MRMPFSESKNNPGVFLNRRYIIAISLIALLVSISHLIFPLFLKTQEKSARVINLAGRQRMLSQRITKQVLTMTLTEEHSQLKELLERFSGDVYSWHEVHQGLQYGNDNLGLPERKLSPYFVNLFQDIDPYFTKMYEASLQIIALLNDPSSIEHVQTAIRPYVDIIQDNEGEFLKRMDHIVFAFDRQTQKALKKIEWINIALLIFILFMLVAEVVFIFIPSNRLIGRQFTKLQQAYDDLRETQEELLQHEKMSVIGRVAAGVAHEIQNPLQIMVQGIGVLTQQSDKNNTTIQHTLSMMTQAVKRAGNILSELLDYARKSKQQHDIVDFNSIVEEALAAMSHQLKNNEGVFIRTHLSPDLPGVYGSKHQLVQVIINLLSNAIQAKNEKEDLTIIVTTRLEEENVVCVVKDNGHGMSDEVKSKVFEPFYTTKLETQGTGLGLSLSKSIVEQHDGKLTLESQLGKGAVFSILMPIYKEERP